MTRINCIPPIELHRKHLTAEYRELPRVFALAYAAYKRGEDPASFPDTYRLGRGHVLFFYPRLAYLERRFDALVLEMRIRGYHPSYTSIPAMPRMPASWWQDWQPTPAAQALCRARIAARMPRD